jgi:hypothetical protein
MKGRQRGWNAQTDGSCNHSTSNVTTIKLLLLLLLLPPQF